MSEYAEPIPTGGLDDVQGLSVKMMVYYLILTMSKQTTRRDRMPLLYLVV